MTDKYTIKLRKFYTIQKREFSYFSQKIVIKNHKFYYREFLPPTYKSVLYIDCPVFERKYDIWFKQNKVSDHIKERFADNIKLQSDVLKIIKNRIEYENYRCWIVKAKTWMGKSHIIMDIIEYLQLRTLILVSNKKLMQELYDKISTMSNAYVSVYGGGKKDLWVITIMTKKSFYLCEKLDLYDFDCVINDECHMGFTKKLIQKFNTSFHGKDIFLYGLSATPSTKDLDEKDLEKYFWNIIEIKKDYDFIPKFKFFNYINDVVYESEHYAELRGMLSLDDKRMKKQKEKLLENISDTCSLILCDRLEEIEYWMEQMQDYDGNLIKITGQTKIKDDSDALKSSLENWKSTLIVGSIQKCATWFDHPIIDSVFIFSAIKFQNTVIQSVGRALRKSPWKTWANIFLWNDKILPKQKIQKKLAIEKEYNIQFIAEEEIIVSEKEKWKLALTF